MKWIRALVFSNVYISLGAGLMMAQMCTLFKINNSTLPYLSFFSSLVLYNFHRLYRFRYNKIVSENRYQWGVNHRYILITLVAVGLIGSIYYAQFLKLNSWIFLAAISLPSFAYVIEFIGKNKKALRDLPGVKIFVVAFVWASYMVYLPAIQHNVLTNSFLIFIEKALFIFSITVPFDIRDVAFDKKHQKTLPQILGVKKAAHLGVLSSILCLLIVFILKTCNIYTLPYSLGQIIVYAISAYLIFLSKKKRNELFYSFLVDGLIILSAIAGILLS